MAWWQKYYDVVNFNDIADEHWFEGVTEDDLFGLTDNEEANIFGTTDCAWMSFGYKHFSRDKYICLLAKPEYRRVIAIGSESGHNAVAWVADDGSVYEFDYDFFPLDEEYALKRINILKEHPDWDIEDYRAYITNRPKYEGGKFDIWGNEIKPDHCQYKA